MNSAWTDNPARYRISLLPEKHPVTKRKTNSWGELLTPWLLVAGFIVFVMMCAVMVEGICRAW